MTKQTKEIVDKIKSRFGSKQGAINKIKDMFKLINIRYKNFEQSGEVESNFFDNYRERFKALTKTKSQDKIATGNLSRMSYKQLDNIINTAESFLWSKFSTKEGRDEIKRKKVDSLRQGGYDLTEKQFDVFVSIMSNPSFKDLLEQKVLDSDQILEAVMDNNNSSNLTKALDIIVDELNDYTSKTNIYKADAYELKELLDVLMNDDDYQNSDIYRQMKGL